VRGQFAILEVPIPVQKGLILSNSAARRSNPFAVNTLVQKKRDFRARLRSRVGSTPGSEGTHFLWGKKGVVRRRRSRLMYQPFSSRTVTDRSGNSTAGPQRDRLTQRRRALTSRDMSAPSIKTAATARREQTTSKHLTQYLPDDRSHQENFVASRLKVKEPDLCAPRICDGRLE